MPARLPGLRALTDSFDDLLVDVWGVLHAGDATFPDVLPALEALVAHGKRVVFVTNSSRSGADVADLLVARHGIARRLFHDVVSSGDVTRAALERRDAELFAGLPARPRCLHVGAPAVVPWLFDLYFDFVDAPGEAELVVSTGLFADEAALARVGEALAPAAARGAPLVCTNPDRIIPSTHGEPLLGPGIVADVYGGRAHFYGKPHPPIYAAALAALGTPRRTVAIGDLLETDVRGARGAGLASVLVVETGGTAPRPGTAGLEERYAVAGVTPDMILDRFAW